MTTLAETANGVLPAIQADDFRPALPAPTR